MTHRPKSNQHKLSLKMLNIQDKTNQMEMEIPGMTMDRLLRRAMAFDARPREGEEAHCPHED
eukprot:3399719-Amphidinium_carterae.1